MAKQITLFEAEKIARELNPDIDRCSEYSDAFIFSKYADVRTIGGPGPVIVMKKNGQVHDMSWYIDEGTLELINEFEL